MKLAVKKHDIDVVCPARLVSGSVNLVRCEFIFDETWDGFAKTAVFASFSGVWAVALVNNAAVIPWEALEAGRRLRIGVYGVRGDVRLPTVYTEPLYVELGAEEGEEPDEPSPGKWEQLMSAIEEGLLRGEDGYTPVKGVDYFTAEEIEAIITVAVERAAAGGGGGANAVQYVAQNLSEAQRARARENIGAVGEEELHTLIDEALGDVTLSLTEMDEVIG